MCIIMLTTLDPIENPNDQMAGIEQVVVNTSHCQYETKYG